MRNEPYNKVDDSCALRWAKKIKAINVLGGKCSCCGNDDFVVLTFHHNKGKDRSVSELLMYRWSDLVREVNRCVLLCKNCHNEHHCTENSRGNLIKKKLLEIKGEHCCSKCKHRGRNLASLEFHHKSEKDFNISDYLAQRPKSISWEVVLLELEKCEVICSNCHLREHTDLNRLNRLKPLIDSKVKNHREVMKALDKDEVVRMIQSGMKQIEIARHFNCAKSTICQIVKAQAQ